MPQRMDSRRLVLLASFGLLIAVVVSKISAAILSTATEDPLQGAAFEVASIKPSSPEYKGEDWDSAGDRVMIKGYSLRKLIVAAYHLKSNAEVTGGPDWLDKKHFDVSAKLDEKDMTHPGPSDTGRDLEPAIDIMLQALLRERFGLRVRPSQKEAPVFALVLHGKKPHLVLDTVQSRSLSIRSGHLLAVATSTGELVDSLSRMREVGDRSVIDRTGLAGRYDFALDWAPDRGNGVAADTTYPGLFTALRDQLGLELKPEKAAVPVIEVLAAELPIYD